MAKFCGNCGAKLDDNAKVCGMCGAMLTTSTPNISGVQYVNPEKKKKTKKRIRRILVLAILIVIAVVAFKIISSFTGHRGLTREIMAAYKNYDIDALVDVSGDMYFYKDEEYAEEYFASRVGEVLDSFDSNVGHNYKLTYKERERYVLSERKKDIMLDMVESRFPDFDRDVIRKIMVVDLTLTAKQGSKQNQKEIHLTLSKEGKEWRLLYID